MDVDAVMAIAPAAFVVGWIVARRIEGRRNYLLALSHVEEEARLARMVTGEDPSPECVARKLRDEVT